ncbi:MAG TPA: nitrate reductase [Kofleriaceae bacterium]|nr:nitrate reductase [Kofleriaceae bacterium]
MRSTCGLCSIGCGVEVAVSDGKMCGIRGYDHPVSRGRLGPKGVGQWQCNDHPTRGKTPLMRNQDRLVESTWDEAMDRIVDHVNRAIAEHGASAVAFYNSGQLLLEEYYTLSKLARGGIGTPNVDSNTRLCTATVGESLMQSFGADGPPGAYEDFEQADCIVLFGHNAAEQSTVLWMRMLAAKEANPALKIITIDPRRTATAKAADLHLAPRPGTNIALVNGIMRWLVENGHFDRDFVDEYTVGFAALRTLIEPYTPTHVEAITGIPAWQLARAAEWIGTSPRVVTTCLQGVYQSNQATATACAVNTMHLVMGKVGKPGCAPFQFAGQPSSMNTRETGADGSYPGYRNWANPVHMADLAKRWNVPVEILGQKPIAAPDIFEQVVAGQVKVLFVMGTNPAASLPDRERMLGGLRDVFLVVMDPFADTETVTLADVYLPTAMWGEKTGCMTNAERRCNLVQKVVEPPGLARSDFDILVDLARRMQLVDRSGRPLIGYTEPREAFEEWKACSKGTIPDYSGMTYEMLVERGGVQWPCNSDRPNGTTRLYLDARFPTSPERAESYLKDLETGHDHSKHEYEKVVPPRDRARLISEAYHPPGDEVNVEYPMIAVSGRLAYHWHTRTKTGKVAELVDAAPRVYVGMHEEDAAGLHIEDGEVVRIVSRRGTLVAPAKIGDNTPRGVIFVPFHFGDPETSPNSVMPALSDPASKQPIQKHAAVRVEKTDGRRDAWWRAP